MNQAKKVGRGKFIVTKMAQTRLSVKRSPTGLGLFALEAIPPEKRMVEYIGSVLTYEEANKEAVNT